MSPEPASKGEQTHAKGRALSAAPEAVMAAEAPATLIDCDTCVVRGDACGDCVVAVLLGAPPDLQADEQRALGVLAEAGLVPPLRLVEPSTPSDPGVSAGPPGDVSAV